jgi:adenylate cyclase
MEGGHLSEARLSSYTRHMVGDEKKRRSPGAAGRALTLVFFFAAALALGCAKMAYDEGPAKAGAVSYDGSSGPLFLLGEWERYDGLLDETAIERAQAGAPRYAEANLRPRYPRPDASGSAAATYRVRVALPSGRPRQMALYVPGLEGYSAAYIDDKLVYARERESAPSPLIFFEPEGGAVSIILQGEPGQFAGPSLLPSVPLVGEAGEVSRFYAFAIGSAIFAIGFFVLLGLFTVLLFLFWRKNVEFLGFALYMFAAGAFYTIKFSVILQLFPATTEFAERAYVYALDLQYLALAFFFWTLYRSRIPKPVTAAVIALPVLFAAGDLALGAWRPAIYTVSLAYFGLFALAVIVWLAALAVRGEERARWLLPAFGIASAAIAAMRLLPDPIVSAFFISPAGLMLFGFVCMLRLVKKVGDSFETVESLSDYVTTVTSTVRSFIPKEFLEYLEKSDVTDLRLGDHVKKAMTIFFSDIRAFTELSERLTVEENFAFINSYLARVVPIIRENGGFVDKYMGDGIMALFPGAAGPDEAIRSAIAMQSKILEYNGHRAKMGYRPISMGVGIHAGDLMLGVVGVSDRMEGTVISDAVNLASRLQAITKAFNIPLAISEQAFKELEDPGSYKYRFIGKVRVKGKAAPVSVFEIFDGLAPDLFERKMKANMFFEQGMLSYYQKDFAGAMYYFKRVLDIIPEDGAAGFYLENCMNKAALS